MTRYEDIRDCLDTGDIVLFSGTGPVSTGIKVGTQSPWSHVGMVVRVDDPTLVLVYQSTTLSKVKDYIDNMPKQGVQINVLSQCVASYSGRIALRRLEVVRSPAMREVLNDFREDMKGRPYETSKLELLRSAYDGPFGSNCEDLSSLFCSELVAEAYQRMGLLLSEEHGGKHSNEFTPKDFSSAHKGLSLLSGARLGEEITIKNP